VRQKLEPVGDEFDSFNDLQDTVLVFEQVQFVQLYVRWSRSIRSALESKRISTTLAKVIEDLLYTEVEYACIHGGKNFKTTSKGDRPNQE